MSDKDKDLTRSEIQAHAYTIAAEYDGNLTVRQLYYQFVARGLLPSGQKVYKRIVNALTAARLDGRFPFDWIIDRTRTANESSAFLNNDDVDSALDSATGWIRDMPSWALMRDRWFGQTTYVTVGVEKEALAGVFDDPCLRLGVGLFVFRGYSSVSALYQLTKSLARAFDNGATAAVVIYFGDHDPDGWEIPRCAERTIHEIAAVEGLSIPDLTFERVGLNMDQIREFNPPPFEAKVSSSRYEGYVAEHDTDEAWELDALRPDVLQTLITESVNSHFDRDVHSENRRHIGERRAEMRAAMREDGWLEEVLND